MPRPDLHGRDSSDHDELIADLQFRDAVEYAVGHNIAALAVSGPEGCREARTAWMPTADVEKVVPREVVGVELGMEALAAAPDAAANDPWSLPPTTSPRSIPPPHSSS